MTQHTGIRRAFSVPLIALALLVMLSAFPAFHHHEQDGRFHNDCAACLLLSSTAAPAAVFVFAVSSFVAARIPFSKTIFDPVLIALGQNKRAPPVTFA